jgi:hypothetical protein
MAAAAGQHQVIPEDQIAWGFNTWFRKNGAAPTGIVY